MPRPKLYIEEELREKHRLSALEWSRRNAKKRREVAKKYYFENKDKINARKRQLRALKKQQANKNILKT